MDEHEMAARIEDLEQKLAWLYQATGYGTPYQAAGSVNELAPFSAGPGSGPGGLSPVVQGLVAQGRKIQAIKQYRQETGAGLKQAKDVIDRFC